MGLSRSSRACCRLQLKDGDARLEQPKVGHEGTHGQIAQRLEGSRERGTSTQSKTRPVDRATDLRYPARPQPAQADVNGLGAALPETELDDAPCVHESEHRRRL